MRTMILALALAASPLAALAQGDDQCILRLQGVADRVPDISANPDVYREMGLSEEQLEAVLATLDAARLIAADDKEGCNNLGSAAESILDSGMQGG